MRPFAPVRMATAAAMFTGAAWTVCAALVALAPGPALWVTEQMLHADLSHTQWNLTPRSFLVGLFAWMFLVWASVAATGWLYRALPQHSGGSDV